MRADTKSLLDRLGQPEFNYREYDESPAKSTDRWPLFELIERQLHPLVSRQIEEAQPMVEAPEEEPQGNDVQALVARIARGRRA